MQWSWPNSSIVDITSSPAAEADRPSLKRSRQEDLHLESPLLPNSEDAISPKRIKIEDHEMSPGKASSPGSSYEEFIDRVAAAAQPAIYKVENESLEQADPLFRLPIPPIESHDPLPSHYEAWTTLSDHGIVGDEELWKGPDRSRDLPWVPIPESAYQVDIAEAFDIEPTSNSPYFWVKQDWKAGNYDEPENEAYTWKPEGLKLLDQDPDEKLERIFAEWNQWLASDPFELLLPSSTTFPSEQQSTITAAATGITLLSTSGFSVGDRLASFMQS